MPKYIVYSSETVLYETVVEGLTEADALVRYNLDQIEDEVDRIGFQTDDIREVEDV